MNGAGFDVPNVHEAFEVRDLDVSILLALFRENLDPEVVVRRLIGIILGVCPFEDHGVGAGLLGIVLHGQLVGGDGLEVVAGKSEERDDQKQDEQKAAECEIAGNKRGGLLYERRWAAA